jgi:putative ABC transport system permease protein
VSRIEWRLEPGYTLQSLEAAWRKQAWWPTGGRVQAPEEGTQRVSTASRAYRVNLTVLALVALFVGAFLVFSVQALSVSQRMPSLALLGVMGLSARQRLQLILAESVLLGLVGSAMGLLLGTGAAWLALRWLAGDLGGGYFPGIAPSLQFSGTAALVFGVLGMVAAVLGGWAPARQAQAMAPAQALKGLGGAAVRAMPSWLGPSVLLLGTALAFAPSWKGLPLAAYGAVALMLLGGIACVPSVVNGVLRWAHPEDQPLAVLAVGRARHERQAATVAVAGVVASLSLAVALTVMVSSFRSGVSQWLEQVLPADLYARTATSSAASEGAFLPPRFIEAASQLPGVDRLEGARVRSLVLDPERPAVSLIARPLSPGTSPSRSAAQVLPMVGPVLPMDRLAQARPAGAVPESPPIAGYVSEAMEMLYGAGPGTILELPLAGSRHPNAEQAPPFLRVMVMGVWRDYARRWPSISRTISDTRETGASTIWPCSCSLEPTQP